MASVAKWKHLICMCLCQLGAPGVWIWHPQLTHFACELPQAGGAIGGWVGAINRNNNKLILINKLLQGIVRRSSEVAFWRMFVNFRKYYICFEFIYELLK